VFSALCLTWFARFFSSFHVHFVTGIYRQKRVLLYIYTHGKIFPSRIRRWEQCQHAKNAVQIKLSKVAL
jgi:hypothetical protein